MPSPTPNLPARAIIVGGGPAGYPCAIRLAQHGVKVTLLEKDRLGGTCLNWGCIPSKALIHHAGAFHQLRNGHLEALGISHSAPTLNWPTLKNHIQGQVSQLREGVQQRLQKLGVEVLRGEAQFISPSHLKVKSLDGPAKTLEAEVFILATGAKTALPKALAFANDAAFHPTVGHIDTFFEMEALPKRLAIIGAGIIGLELAQACARLGVEVHVFEREAEVLPDYEKRFTKALLKILEAEGVTLHLKASVEGAKLTSDGTVSLQLAGEETAPFNKILVVPGRQPNTQGLKLEAAGVVVHPQTGGVETGTRFESSQPHIYAVGDVGHGHAQLAHVATHQGLLLADILAGKRQSRDALTKTPAVMYTQPELARVGHSLESAKAAGFEAKQTFLPFAALGRALVEGASQGQALLVVDEASGAILGAQAMAPHADVLISQMVQAMELGATVEDIALTVHPHPSLSECWLEAAERHLGHGVHLD